MRSSDEPALLRDLAGACERLAATAPAAGNWIGLSDDLEALERLDKIRGMLQQHPSLKGRP